MKRRPGAYLSFLSQSAFFFSESFARPQPLTTLTRSLQLDNSKAQPRTIVSQPDFGLYAWKPAQKAAKIGFSSSEQGLKALKAHHFPEAALAILIFCDSADC
jgi:hypothetical protein